MSKVVPIRPGLRWEAGAESAHTLPPGITVEDVMRGDDHMQLSVDLAGKADALVVTHDQLASIPKSGRKSLECLGGARVGRMLSLTRRKHDFVVHVVLYGEGHPDIPRFVAMLDLDRKHRISSMVHYHLTRGAVAVGEMWDQLDTGNRITVELLLKNLLQVKRAQS